MKSPLGLVLVLLLGFAGCSSSEQRGTDSASTSQVHSVDTKSPSSQPVAAKSEADATKTFTDNYALTASGLANAGYEQVSMNQVDTAASAAEAADRKIIRNANLTLEVNSTSDTQHRVASIAESHGGF